MKAPAATALFLATLLTLDGAPPAAAHGFGQRYDLPVPLSLYLGGAAAAVLFSFLLLGVFLRGAQGAHRYPRINLLRWAPFRLITHPAVLVGVKAASVSVFALFLAVGLFGNQHPLRNLAPTLVWVIWWVGLSYVSALAGNLWAVINPWRAVFECAENLHGRLRAGRELSLHLPYPRALGVWPGVFLFFVFAWVELVFPGRAVPKDLAALAIGYSLLTWSGMYLFGRERWLQRGEAFSLAFGLLSRFAPTERRVTRRALCESCDLDCRAGAECVDCPACFARAAEADRELNLRPFAVGLLRADRASLSMMGFILLMLSTVTFDGIMATPAWAWLEDILFNLLPGPGAARLIAAQTMGLIAFPVLFLAVYLVVIRCVVLVSGAGRSVGALAPIFAFTLVPIAIAYHLAHYLSFLVIQGQLIIPLASDPFGVGWNLFGTAGYRTNIGAVGARFAWLTAVIAIVAGHIIAVYLAHVLAMVALGGGARALRSQYPVTALMVGYTMVSLWILAQPIVESGLRSSAEERPGGLRVVRVERTARTLGELRLVQETPVIEVYLTAAAGTAEDAAALAPPWSTLPWELVVLMEETVSRGWAAFSREAAASRGVEWLDLVRAAGLKERMAGLAQELERRAYVPESLREMVTPAEARERWAALRAFYAARGHWLVTNGPYILARWTADSAVLEVFRDLSYPLGVGSFDDYAIPSRAYVSRIELAEGRLTITADIDELEKFGRSYNLVRTPFRPGASTSMRADVVAARYLVIGPGGHVVKTGTVPPGPDAVFRADLAGTLPAGRYALLVALSLNENAVAPDIRRLEYVVPDHPR